MAFGALRRQWIVWKAAFQAESDQPPNRAIPEGPAVEFLPEALDLQQKPPSPIGRALLWTILIGCVTGAAWTIQVRVDSVTAAPGRVISSGDAKRIYPSEAGVLTAIHVQDRQAVKQGDVLIELDSTRNLVEVERQSHALVSDFQQATQTEQSVLETSAVSLAQEARNAERKSGVQQVRSPIDGVVEQLMVRTVGTVVTPMKPMLMVVSRDRSVEIEAHVERKDLVAVHKGQPVAIKIDTVQLVPHETIPGHVLEVSNDATSIKHVGLGSSIRVGVARSTIQVEGTQVRFSPGMGVTVEIKTGQRRLIEYLLEPFLHVMNERVRGWNALVHAARGLIDRRNLS